MAQLSSGGDHVTMPVPLGPGHSLCCATGDNTGASGGGLHNSYKSGKLLSQVTQFTVWRHHEQICKLTHPLLL